MSVSLAWNDPSDLDLYANIFFDDGTFARINYQNKAAAGGYLDVDMHARDGEEVSEPVENIYWKKPLPGLYSVSAKLFKKRGSRTESIPFRALLKCEGEEDVSHEGALGERGQEVEIFRFTVKQGGDIKMEPLGTPLPITSSSAVHIRRPSARVAPRAMKAAMKRCPMKVMKVKKPAVARGKKAKVLVYKGKCEKTRTGLKKEDLVKSKKNKVVCASRSKQGKESKWAKATAQARAIKGYVGFKAIKKGTSFYEKAKEILSQL